MNAGHAPPRGFFPLVSFQELEQLYWGSLPVVAQMPNHEHITPHGHSFPLPIAANVFSSPRVSSKQLPQINGSNPNISNCHMNVIDLHNSQKPVSFQPSPPPCQFDSITDVDQFNIWLSWARSSWKILNQERKNVRKLSGSKQSHVQHVSTTTVSKTSKSRDEELVEDQSIADWDSVQFPDLHTRLNNSFTLTETGCSSEIIFCWDFVSKYEILFHSGSFLSSMSLERFISCFSTPLEHQNQTVYNLIMCGITRCLCIPFEKPSDPVPLSFEEEKLQFTFESSQTLEPPVSCSTWPIHLQNWIKSFFQEISQEEEALVFQKRLNIFRTVCNAGFAADDWFQSLGIDHRFMLLQELILNIITSQRFRSLMSLYSSQVHTTSRKIYIDPSKNAVEKERSLCFEVFSALNGIVMNIDPDDPTELNSKAVISQHLSRFKARFADHKKSVFNRRQAHPLRPTVLGRDRYQRTYWLFGDCRHLIFVQGVDNSWGFYKADKEVSLLKEILDTRGKRENALLNELERLSWIFHRNEKTSIHISDFDEYLLKERKMLCSFYVLANYQENFSRCETCQLIFSGNKCLRKHDEYSQKAATDLKYHFSSILIAKALLFDIEFAYSWLNKEPSENASFDCQTWRKNLSQADNVQEIIICTQEFEGHISRDLFNRSISRTRWKDELSENPAIANVINLLISLDRSLRWSKLENMEDMEDEDDSSDESAPSSNESVSSDADIECHLCQKSDGSSDFIICDECDLYYHQLCLNPPLHSIPRGNWYCDSCLNKTRSTGSQRKRRR